MESGIRQAGKDFAKRLYAPSFRTSIHIYKTYIMNTQQIADRLVELCNQGQFETAQNELFSKDAVSTEPHGMPGIDKVVKGLPAIIEKGHAFQGMVEKSYGSKASKPMVSGSAIAFTLEMDAQMKGREREKMSEICVYEVKEGKIVSEQFFM
jgi:hypothetical protein